MTRTKNFDEANELAKLAAPKVRSSVVQARHWIRTGTAPHNPLIARAWAKALAAARVKLAKAVAK